MPPLGNKGKAKVKENRQSRSRNTTPSSVLSAPGSGSIPGVTAYLEIPLGSLSVPLNLQYEDLLESHGGTGGIPEPKSLKALAHDLKSLSELAVTREVACDGAMRNLSNRRKLKLEEDLEPPRTIPAETPALLPGGESVEPSGGLKQTAEDEMGRVAEPGKVKKKKDQVKARDERPLTHGAHGVARQDGADATPKGKASASPSKAKMSQESGSSSSLSPPSQAPSPTPADTNPKAPAPARSSPTPSSSSEGSRQPPPAASIPQYQTFGSNPLTFDDPTVYHVREVTDDMTDDEKREIYNVASFPKSDLHDLIAGTPPDRDFSNAKPTNQVNANTFLTYLEPYFRPLNEEDIAFLKERGDRRTPFITPRRGLRHYKEVWAEEDAQGSREPSSSRKLPENQPRGNVEQLDDNLAETDQVSGGPVLNRLLSTLRFEHRPEEKEKPNGTTNGDTFMNGMTNGDHGSEHGLGIDTSASGAGADDTSQRPVATAFPEAAQPGWKVPTARSDFAATDERLKQELRYLGFLGADAEPDYDAHQDDEIGQRIRELQGLLKQTMIRTGAMKARLLPFAEERMGHQEFTTISDDLDHQLVQAYTKRNRSLGKGKKHAKRPAGADGASAAGGAGAGVSKPGIGDLARTLMDRRTRWKTTIEPIFSDDVRRVRGPDESIFKEEDMRPFYQAERERLEEEMGE